MSAEYEIATLGDFAKIPADRLDACLHDFALWVGIKRQFEPASFGIDGTLANGERLRIGRADLTMLETFTWFDDGIEGVSAIDVKVTQEFEETPQ